MELDFGAIVPFVEHLGFTLERSQDGVSELHHVPRPEHRNSFGAAHGGVVMTLLDVAMAVAARSVAPEWGVVTVEMKTSFMQPAPGDSARLIGRGRLRHRTRSLAFVEAELFDADGRLCAQATGTFKYVQRRDNVVPTD